MPIHIHVNVTPPTTTTVVNPQSPPIEGLLSQLSTYVSQYIGDDRLVHDLMEATQPYLLQLTGPRETGPAPTNVEVLVRLLEAWDNIQSVVANRRQEDKARCWR